MKEKSGQSEKEANESSALKTAGPEGEITAGLCENCLHFISGDVDIKPFCKK